MKYKIVTFGCQMNVHESEKLSGVLHARGYEPVEGDEQADIVVFNTCCVRESAETRAMGNIGALKKQKQSNPNMIIGVCGCMPQQDGVAQKLLKKYPHIDIIFGTHNLHTFDELISKRQSEKKSVLEVWDSESGIFEDMPIKRDQRNNAWVNIMYGCNNFCSYCIVPFVRGRERSRQKGAVIEEVRGLVLSGVKQITLLGQNVNSYGNDFDAEGNHFADLINEICQIEGEFRLKFMTSHPKDLSNEVIKAIANNEKASNYIHLPMQSGSDRILSLMNRKYTAEQYFERIDTIRKYIPDCGISSDFMVGFPSETDSDFLSTMDAVKRVQYDLIYSFIYSKRSGTIADKMNGHIELPIKRKRVMQLIELQSQIGQKRAQSQVGTTTRVLALEHKDGKLLCESDTAKAIEVEGGSELVNSFFNVEIVSHRKTKLYGKRIEGDL